MNTSTLRLRVICLPEGRRYLDLKVGKKAKNVRSGHMYDVIAFFGGSKKSKKLSSTHGMPYKTYG